MAFAPGDIVALKSGGHSMTVVAIEAEDVNASGSTMPANCFGSLFRRSR
jgi:uncharacterized protein YodC (DUF2158 family)